MPRLITLPLYLIRDAELTELASRCEEVMTELAGESDTAELPPVILALREEIARRSRPVTMQPNGDQNDG